MTDDRPRPTPDAPVTRRSVLDELAQEARVQRRARMLPQTPLTQEQMDKVRRDFKVFARESGRSLDSLSRQLGTGYSASVLSMWQGGNYRGDNDKITRTINELLEREARSQELPRPEGFVEIEVAQYMMAVIRTAIAAQAMGLITGFAGCGKTMTLEAARAMLVGTILQRVDISIARPKGLISSIARQIGVKTTGSLAHVFGKVCEHLEGSKRPVLIDEAHRLSTEALELIRDLHDVTGVPIVLVGTVGLNEKVDDRAMQFGQFSSRMVARIDINEFIHSGGHRGAARKLYSIDEVKKIFESEKLKITDTGWEMLWTIACLPGLGGLRMAGKILAVSAGMDRSKQVTGKRVLAIAQHMHGDAYMELMKARGGESTLRLAATA